MKFLLVTYGSEGDTRPMVALAAGLQARGHAVVLAGEGSGRAIAETHGVGFVTLAGDLAAKMRGGESGRIDDQPSRAGAGAVQRTMRSGGTAQGFLAVQQLLAAHATEWVATLAGAAADADLVAGSSLAGNVAQAVAVALGRPGVTLLLQPMRPTRQFALLGPPLPPNPFNRWGQSALLQAGWWAARPSVHRALRAHGLAVKPIDWWQVPVLDGFSPTLVPPPSDWPGFDHVCGDWPLPVPGWEPSDDLADFMVAGDPPAYVGFGSMAGYDAGRLLATVVAGLGTRRAVLAPGWSATAPEGLPADIRVIGPTPHDWLFPRCSVVVHHCGAGTTHAAARAGVPQVPVPFVADQPFWARRLRRLGVAPTVLDRHRLTADDLDRALVAATRVGPRRAAVDLASRMATEHGVETACDLLEEAARGGTAAGPD